MNERNTRQENTEEFYNELQQATQERANEPERSTKKISWFAMIVKIIIFPLTIISLALSGIGLLFAILQIISNVSKKHHAPIGLEARFCLKYGLAGMIATGLFFITKKLHSIYKEYTLYAILFWIIVGVIIVVAEPQFYTDFLNMIQEIK
ncbi:hypothetical protein II898_04790 [bacterium]|nr:hypothetical protein [bacterium]